MTATCNTCQHWGEPDGYDYWTDGRVHTCMAIGELNRVDAADRSTNLAFTIDAEHYHSSLITAPTFSCALHQPKDGQK